MVDDLIYSRNRSDFIDSVISTVEQRDGNLLNDLLNVSRMYQIEDLIFDENEVEDRPIPSSSTNDEKSLWKQLSQHHWSVCRYLANNDIERSFQHQSKKFALLMNIFNIHQTNPDRNTNDSSVDDETAWLLPVFNRQAQELRLLALLGNDEGNDEGNDLNETSQPSTGTIQTCSRQLLQSVNVVQRFPSTSKLKKIGIFIIINQILKMYYSLQQFNLCRYVIPKGSAPLDRYIAEENSSQEIHYSSHVLTYRYFVGKSLILQHRYDSAAEHFEYVFLNCLQWENWYRMKNKQQSLLYLVVLKMLYGDTPRMEILEKYQLDQLIDLIEPVRTGSLKLLMEKISEHEQYLLDNGLLFLVENFKFIAIRNLFRLTINPTDPEQTDKIPMDPNLLFLINFGFEPDEPFNINDLIDILNSMIQKGMLKGYISYKHRTLVLSRKDPFPRRYQFTSLLNAS